MPHWFDTKVEKVYQDEKGRWIINNLSQERFEGIITAVRTCGDAKSPTCLEWTNSRARSISSDWTGKEAKGKKMIIIGGGASAVEALEFVLVSQGLGFDCNQMVGKLVVYIFRDI
jgi:cation diffusion facilitator CzcD-associated flavoprotein CzcO